MDTVQNNDFDSDIEKELRGRKTFTWISNTQQDKICKCCLRWQKAGLVV
jgi:hypothetical protein